MLGRLCTIQQQAVQLMLDQITWQNDSNADSVSLLVGEAALRMQCESARYMAESA